MRKPVVFVSTFLLLVCLLAACSSSLTPVATTSTSQESTQTDLPPSSSPEPSATTVPTSTATATNAPTPTETTIPFDGFLPDFRYYRSWYDKETTVFYFLNAGVDHTLYGKADEFDMLCNPDPEYPVQMKCIANTKIEGRATTDFEFFTDPARKNSVFKKTYNTGLVDNTVWHNQNNCPDRGKNVHCESEYRLYDGVCYYSHTCYDACGLYYSRDNLPKVFNEFQGFTGPCN